MSPIKPENAARYPSDWRETSQKVKERAGWKCEWCGVRHGDYGYRNDNGEFVYLTTDKDGLGGLDRGDVVSDLVRDVPRKIIRIVLTTAHLDHDPANNDLSNLRALCQKCHLDYDRDHHVKSARKTREIRSGQMPLLNVEGRADVKH